MRSNVIGSRGGSAKSSGNTPIALSRRSISSLLPNEISTTSHTCTSNKNSLMLSIPTCGRNEVRQSPLARTLRFVQSVPSLLSLGLIRMYQRVVSPLLRPACRFEPTCSCYAAESIQRYGFFRGGWLAAKRLCRCHPFSRHSGFDPVPSLQPANPSKESE